MFEFHKLEACALRGGGVSDRSRILKDSQTFRSSYSSISALVHDQSEIMGTNNSNCFDEDYNHFCSNSQKGHVSVLFLNK